MKNKSKKARGYSSPLLKGLLENRNELETNRTRNRMLLAARIDDLLKAKGWKKKELAEKLNKKPSVITKWLSGTHNFTLDTLSDLESVFGEKISIGPKVIYPNLEEKVLSGGVSEPNFEWGEFFIEMKFTFLKQYIQKIENLRLEEVDLYKKEYYEKIKDTKWYENIGDKFDYGFKSLGDQLVSHSFYHSSFLYTFSQFESLVKHVGKVAKEKSKSRLKLNDLSGSKSEIIRLKIYLTKHLNLDFNNTMWNKILPYIDLRNQMVHSGWLIENIESSKNKNLINHIKNNTRIDYYPHSVEEVENNNLNNPKNSNEANSQNQKSANFQINDIQYLMDFCDDAKKFTISILNSLEQIKT